MINEYTASDKTMLLYMTLFTLMYVLCLENQRAHPWWRSKYDSGKQQG